MGVLDLVRQEIEWLRREIDDHNYYLDNSEQALGYSAALDEIEKFLNTLSEEPDKRLEEAAKEYMKKARKHLFDDSPIGRTDDAFIAGAEWMRRKMMKDAVEGEVVQDLKGRFHIKTNAVSDILYQFGDKVKVIILKQ